MRDSQIDMASPILLFSLRGRHCFIHELGKIRGDLSVATLRDSMRSALGLKLEREFHISNIIANSEDSINNCISELLRRIYIFCKKSADQAQSYYSKQKIIYGLCRQNEYFDSINNAFRKEFASKVDTEEKSNGDIIFTIEV